MEGGWLRSPRTIWCVLYALHLVAILGGVLLLWYAVVTLRVEKLEVVYRIEGVPFGAGPQGVPAEKWERMSATDHEIIEPMADWVQRAGWAIVTVSSLSLTLLLRLSPHLNRTAGPPVEPADPVPDGS